MVRAPCDLSNLLVLLIVVLVLIQYGHNVVDTLTNGVAAVAAITVVLALVAGWTAVSSRSGLRIVVAVITAVRANGFALAIAQASFPYRLAVHAAVATFAVFSVVVPVTAAFLLAGWRTAHPSCASAVL